MATLTLQRDLLGARASFQRLRDAKILHGWIDAVEGPRVTIRSSSNATLMEGDSFILRTACLTSDVSFEMTLVSISDEDNSALMALAAKGNCLIDMDEQKFTFEVSGRVVTSPLSGDPRYLCEQGTATIGPHGVEASLRDISPRGVGVISPVPFNRGEVLTIEVYTAAGQVTTNGEVRYCRKVGEMPVSYRIGFQLPEMDRVNRARWNTLINRA